MSSANRGVSGGPWWESPVSEESAWVVSASVSGSAFRASGACIPSVLRARGAWRARLRESPKKHPGIEADRTPVTERVSGPSQGCVVQGAHLAQRTRHAREAERASD
ncbi:hypothetical protein NDU88_009133 [Pleurodeles waltl]|uniref:Uncharacterized protein n=1 Tax=Pleurodeles waltl TaxID=8319 RepID=A0AAV7RVQ8_PLEWA|nr:hypothetical protein NDU88_009133 [Pleurodeles waltl]